MLGKMLIVFGDKVTIYMIDTKAFIGSLLPISKGDFEK